MIIILFNPVGFVKCFLLSSHKFVIVASGLAEESVGESTTSDQVQPPGGSEIQEAQGK